MLGDLTAWATDVIAALGYLGVALLVALENVFPPIPSEVVLGLAGYTAARGDASVVGMIVAATTGSVVGAWCLYGFAAAVGPVRIRAIVIRYGSWTGVSEPDLDRAEQWFDRRARIAVLVCRCVPLIRSLISVPAGLRRMPLGTFTLYTTIGSLAWNTVFVVAGYLLADQWDRILEVTEPFQTATTVAVVSIIAVLVVRKVLKLRRERDAEEHAHPGITHERLEEVVADLQHRTDDTSPQRTGGDTDDN